MVAERVEAPSTRELLDALTGWLHQLYERDVGAYRAVRCFGDVFREALRYPVEQRRTI